MPYQLTDDLIDRIERKARRLSESCRTHYPDKDLTLEDLEALIYFARKAIHPETTATT